MRSTQLKASLTRSGLAASLLLVATGLALADSAVTLTAAPATATLPDGQSVPMWGYACGAATDDGVVTARVSCTAANGQPQTGGWQPPLITVPSGEPLTITLINNLSFTTTGAPNNIPTSLVIVGQLGGGLGAAPQRMPSPTHGPQGTTWPARSGSTGRLR